MNKKWLLLLLIPLLLFAGSKWFKSWLDRHVELIINRNPENRYHLTYENLDIHRLYQGFTVQHVRIQPRKSERAKLNATVLEIRLNDVQWIDLILNGHLNVSSLHFESPEIKLEKEDSLRSDRDKNQPDRALQTFFGEIISNIQLNEFRLNNGEIVAFEKDSSRPKYSLNSLNIRAHGILTDSVVFKYTIPFYLDSISIDAKDLSYQIDDYTEATLDSFHFSSSDESVFAAEMRLRLAKRWDSLSVDMGYQADLLEVSIDSITIKTGQIFDDNNDWILKGNYLSLYQLVLKDYRNKNVPRPEEKETPLFNVMLHNLPIPIQIDTLKIINGDICYTEWPLQGERPGTICFESSQASIFNINNISEKDSALVCLVDFKGKINGVADMQANIEIPFDSTDRFYMDVKIKAFPANALNKTLQPLINFEAKNGQFHEIEYHIQANTKGANCQLMMIYDDLQIELSKDSQIENKLLNILANAFIKKNRTRDDEDSFHEYYTERNLHRGPFHLMWKGMKEGMLDILPTNSGKKILDSKNN